MLRLYGFLHILVAGEAASTTEAATTAAEGNFYFIDEQVLHFGWMS